MKTFNLSIVSALLTGLICTSAAYAAKSTGGDGTIVVLGGITASTCSIAANDQYQVIRLPIVGNNAFQNGSAGATNFSINLENCPENSFPGVFFDVTNTTEISKGWMKAYQYDGATYPGAGNTGEISNKKLDALFLPSADADHLATIKGNITAGSSPASDNLFFRLLDSNFNPMKIGDEEQRKPASGMWVTTKVGADQKATINGAVEYVLKDQAVDPAAGYYYSYTTFTLQYN